MRSNSGSGSSPWLAAVLALGLLAVPAAAAESDKPSARVGVRIGDHPGFSRIVFDFTGKMDYTVAEDAGRIRITFNGTAPLALDILRNRPPHLLTGVEVQQEGDKTVLLLTVPADVKPRHFRDGTKIALDLVASPAATAEKAPPATPVAKTEAPAEVKASPGSAPAQPATASPPAASAPKTLLPPKVAAAPAAPAPASAPANAATARALQQVGRPDAPTVVVGEEIASRPARAPAAPPPPPVAADQLRKAGRVDPRAVAKAEAPATNENLVVSAQSARSGPTLTLPWTRPVNAAAFRRGNVVWLVFDRSAQLDLKMLTADSDPMLTTATQVAHPSATVLRLEVPAGTNPVLARLNAVWAVTLSDKPPATVPGLPVERQPDVNGDVQLRILTAVAGDRIDLTDPDVGDQLIVVPVGNVGQALPNRQDFIQFSLLPSVLGVVVAPKSETLDVTTGPEAITVTASSGLFVTPGKSVSNAPLLQFAEWSKGASKQYLEKEREMLQGVAQAAQADRAQARFNLAKFYFAQGFNPEALSALQRMTEDSPEADHDKVVRAIRGVANYRLGRLDEAMADLGQKIFDDEPEIAIWRGAVAAAAGNWSQAQAAFAVGVNVLNRYPAEVRGPIRLQMARAWVGKGDTESAESELRALEFDKIDKAGNAEALLLRAELADALGKPVEAAKARDEAIAIGDRRGRAFGVFARTEAQLAAGEIDLSKAIDRLEALRFSWRGDTFEFNLLRRLGEHYIAADDPRAGLLILRNAVNYYPESPEADDVSKEITDNFVKLFAGDGADRLPPITALALFYDFRDLTPKDSRGDLIITRLADRLASIDLLNRAAELLEYQIQYRLQGEDKARAGSRLAVVYLLDHKPEQAIKALKATLSPNLPAPLADDRRRLESRALSELGKSSEALAMINGDNSQATQILRADIYWRLKDWPRATAALDGALGDRWKDSTPLTAIERKRVLQLGVASSLTGDADRLAQVNSRYSPRLDGTPEADSFRTATGQKDGSAKEIRQLASSMAQVSQLDAYMASYRDRVAKEGLSGIN